MFRAGVGISGVTGSQTVCLVEWSGRVFTRKNGWNSISAAPISGQKKDQQYPGVPALGPLKRAQHPINPLSIEHTEGLGTCGPHPNQQRHRSVSCCKMFSSLQAPAPVPFVMWAQRQLQLKEIKPPLGTIVWNLPVPNSCNKKLSHFARSN